MSSRGRGNKKIPPKNLYVAQIIVKSSTATTDLKSPIAISIVCNPEIDLK